MLEEKDKDGGNSKRSPGNFKEGGVRKRIST